MSKKIMFIVGTLGGEIWIMATSAKDAIRQAKESYRIDGIDLRGRGKRFTAKKHIDLFKKEKPREEKYVMKQEQWGDNE